MTQLLKRLDVTPVFTAHPTETVRRTKPDFMRDVYADVVAAQEHFAELCAMLDQHCGVDAPPSSNIKNALGDVNEALVHLANEHFGIQLDATYDNLRPLDPPAT